MSTPILHVQRLVKQFGEFFAVNDISFDIRPGEILGLLGPNGAGKTTTIQMLLGVVTPTAGSIQMFGLDLAVLLGGAFITETVFGLPGVGQYAVRSIFLNDFPAVMGVTLFAAFFIATIVITSLPVKFKVGR